MQKQQNRQYNPVPTNDGHRKGEVGDRVDPNSSQRQEDILPGTFEIVCSSLDGSVLTIPFIIVKCGLVLGPALIAIFAMVAVVTLENICICSRKLGVGSYSASVDRLLGFTARILLDIFSFLILFTIVVGFLILLRQVGSDIVYYFAGFYISSWIIPLVGIALCFPFSLAKDIYALRYNCYVSSLAVAGLLLNLVVLFSFVVRNQRHDSHHHYYRIKYGPDNWMDVLEALPLIAVLFTSHFNINGVFKRLKNPTESRINTTIIWGTTILSFLFISLGVIGYFVFAALFNNTTSDNVLFIFSPNDSAIIVARFLMVIAILFTLPVFVLPARASIYDIRNKIAKKLSEDESQPAVFPPVQTMQQQHAQYGTQSQYGHVVPPQQTQQQQQTDPTKQSQQPQPDRNKPLFVYQQQQAERDAETGHNGHDGNGKYQNGHTQPAEADHTRRNSTLLDGMVTAVLLGLAFVIAQYIHNVSTFWEIAGSLLVLPVTVFVPAVLYQVLKQRMEVEFTNTMYPSWILAILSAPLVILCAWHNIARVV